MTEDYKFMQIDCWFNFQRRGHKPKPADSGWIFLHFCWNPLAHNVTPHTHTHTHTHTHMNIVEVNQEPLPHLRFQQRCLVWF